MTAYPTVSFAEFARVMRRQGIDEAYLVKRFRTDFVSGTGEARAFFERVFDPRYANVVIANRPVIEFYLRETGAIRDASDRDRRCACGCGQRVFGRKKWASKGCRQRGYRRRVADRSKMGQKAA